MEKLNFKLFLVDIRYFKTNEVPYPICIVHRYVSVTLQYRYMCDVDFSIIEKTWFFISFL